MQKMTKIRKKNLFFMAALSLGLPGSLFLIACLLVRYTKNSEKVKIPENTLETIQERTAQNISEKVPKKTVTGNTPDENSQLSETNHTETNQAKKKTGRNNTFETIPATIRVCIRSDHYKNELHDSISITSDAPWTLFEAEENSSNLNDRKEIQKFGKEEVFSVSSADFSCGTHLIAVPSEGNGFYFPELQRNIPKPEYEGEIYLYVEKDGLFVVNEVELETYLKSVVASEMPSSYPMEALKAQAVCARTYAVRRIEAQKNKNSFSDLDDSVSFQVYNNQIVSDASAHAVDETKGEILPFSEALYYSTAYVPGSEFMKVPDAEDSDKKDSVSDESDEEFWKMPCFNAAYSKTECLNSTYHDLDLSDNEVFDASLKALPDENAEYGSLWVRWHTVLDVSSVLAQLKQQSGEEFSFLEHIEVSKRSSTGQANELLLGGNGRAIRIEGEYEIRSVLAPKEIPVCLNNGQEITGLTLLPSAWLSIEPYDSQTGKLFLSGGGYGHGTGMSQCGAAAMAEEGADYRKILDYYYGESELEHVKDL